MIKLLAMTLAGCRRMFPRHLLHKITTLALPAVIVAFVQTVDMTAVAAESRRSPNIVLIMADEKGCSPPATAGNRLENAGFPALFAVSRITGNQVKFRGIPGD